MEEKKEDFENILAKEDLDLFLKVNKSKTFSNLPPMLSDTGKLLLILFLINIFIGIVLSLITKQSHFVFFAGSTWVIIPWFLAFFDGIFFIIYGIIVIKRKRGQIDISSSSSSTYVTKEFTGDSASPLGLIYILLGIFLLITTIIQILI